MRVLFVNAVGQIGGAERSLLDLMGGLPREQYRLHLVVPRSGPLVDAARGLGVQVAVISWPRMLERLGRERTLYNKLALPTLPLTLLPVALRLARYAREHRVDVIHTNGTKVHLAGAICSLLTGTPLIWHMRDVMAPGALGSAIRRLARSSPRCIIANSRASAEGITGGDARVQVRVIYNGIDPNRYRPVPRNPELRRSLGLDEGDFVIGAFGVLAPFKGHIHLIRAMRSVLRAVPRARLLLVGDEVYETSGHHGYRRVLEAEAQDLGGRVVFAGLREDVVPLYSLCDVVVLSTVRTEPFGRVLAEAMACGRPVIGTDTGGPREIIDDPSVGLLVPPGDPEEMSAAILRLHADESLRRSLSERGRRKVLECFSVTRHIAEVSAVYDLVVGNRTVVAEALPKRVEP